MGLLWDYYGTIKQHKRNNTVTGIGTDMQPGVDMKPVGKPMNSIAYGSGSETIDGRRPGTCESRV